MSGGIAINLAVKLPWCPELSLWGGLMLPSWITKCAVPSVSIKLADKLLGLGKSSLNLLGPHGSWGYVPGHMVSGGIAIHLALKLLGPGQSGPNLHGPHCVLGHSSSTLVLGAAVTAQAELIAMPGIACRDACHSDGIRLCVQLRQYQHTA